MRKILTFGIVLILLATAACQGGQLQEASPVKPAASAAPVQNASHSASVSAPITPEDLLMRDYVRIYETYCGAEFDAVPAMDMLERYLLGWLTENGGADRYAVYNDSKIDYYSLPRQDARTFYQFYFAGDTSALSGEESAALRFDTSAAVEKTEGLDLKLESFEALENGGYRLTIQREKDGRAWCPAEYEFAALTAAEELPRILDGKITRGTAAYQFVSMRNLPREGIKEEGKLLSIRTPEELVKLAETVNAGDSDYQNNVYQLTADLDMKDVAFIPIGGYGAGDARDPAPSGFGTTFDGRGHTIRNLTITKHDGMTGLFAQIGANGFVTNLKLENCDISSADANYKEGGGSYTGGIAGAVMGGAVSRCTVTGRITGTRNVGGIAGVTDGGANVQESLADVRISGNKRVGGVAGYAIAGRLSACTAVGEVYGVELNGVSPIAIGGFVGELGQATIDRGIVSVETSAAPPEIAGSFAGHSSGKLIGCFYSTDVSKELSPVGGIEAAISPKEELIGMSRAELEEMGAFQKIG